ncbi:MAG: SPOR domain-containing protein [Ferruginibacter sp.]
MKLLFSAVLIFISCNELFAQDTLADVPLFGKVTVTKDSRIDILSTKMGDYNQSISLRKTRTARGYRLMLLSTNNRSEALSLRSSLIQQYPDHKVYMIFQTPFIKIKFGNYVDKKDAEDMRKQLLKSGLITGNIYLLSETVEVKPEKIEEDL